MGGYADGGSSVVVTTYWIEIMRIVRDDRGSTSVP